MLAMLQLEFLLPLTYNNGKRIEPEKFFMVKELLLRKFGGISIYPIPTEGLWMDLDNNAYNENCKRFEICIKKSRKNIDWFCKYKKHLEGEFKQKEIYMIMIEVWKL